MSEARAGRGFGYWLNVFANLAVVGGIVFLGVEIRQNTDMIESQIMQSRTEAAMSEQQAFFNSDYLPAIEVKVRRGEELTAEEMLRYERDFRSFNRNMDNQLWQYRRGFLGENIPRSVRAAVRNVMGRSPLTVEMWDSSKRSYTDEYIAFVDEAIADLRSSTP